jgi:hypothetical protein
MKSIPSLKLATFAALAAFCPVLAQSPVPMSSEESAGLIGQAYSGLEVGYVHHIESAPRALHHYSFVSSAPIGELGPTVDAAFRYDYVRGSMLGMTGHQHTVMASFLKYAPLDHSRPFVHADAGWLWQKSLGQNESSFVYRVGAGIEILLKPRLALTPYAVYRDARQVEERSWNFGAKLAHRMHRQWSGTLGVQFDDERNVEWSLGIQRRF